MPTITGGFDTSNIDEVKQKLAVNGIKIRLPFTATNFVSTKDPMPGLFVDNEGNDFEPTGGGQVITPG